MTKHKSESKKFNVRAKVANTLTKVKQHRADKKNFSTENLAELMNGHS